MEFFFVTLLTLTLYREGVYVMCEKGENGVYEVKTEVSGGALHAEEAKTVVSGTEKITFTSEAGQASGAFYAEGYGHGCCRECRFWAAVVVGSKGEELEPEQIKVGACKFNPPVFVNQLSALGSAYDPSPRKERTVQAWPDTKVDDWCGRFEPEVREPQKDCDALRDKALRVNGYSAGDMREQWEGLTRKEIKALREMSRRYAGGDDVFNKELAELVIGMEPELVNEGAKAFDGYFVHWDKIIEVCAKAWPGERADYGECPTELICRIIDERDDERRFLKRVIRQNQKLIDTIAEAVEILGPEVEVTPETPGYVLIRVRALKELRKGIEAVTVEPTRTVEVEGTESTNEFCGCRGGY